MREQGCFQLSVSANCMHTSGREQNVRSSKMSAMRCDLNRSMQHLNSNPVEADVENESSTADGINESETHLEKHALGNCHH